MIHYELTPYVWPATNILLSGHNTNTHVQEHTLMLECKSTPLQTYTLQHLLLAHYQTFCHTHLHGQRMWAV